MSVPVPVVEKKDVPNLQGYRIPQDVLQFCVKHGLWTVLDTAVQHVKECFPAMHTLEFEVIEDEEFEGLSIVVAAKGERSEVAKQYWACLRKWSNSFEPEVLSKLVLNRLVA